MTDEELKTNPAVEQEWDIQWEIFRLLADCEERDIELIKGSGQTCARLVRAISV
ncbi:putative cytoplasmic protein [Salmonella enterica subsp. enterica]|nr:putative cytoplasmic protein [Salmonella enterica subsp. enterica]